jgi:hypothetical protein
MYLNARQLEQMLREQGAITLPYGARLTPAAQDLVRARGLSVQYVLAATKPAQTVVSPAAVAVKPFLWWSGIASGPAKAALAMASRESSLVEMAILEDATKSLAAIRHLNASVKNNLASGGILVVEHAGATCVLANRCPALRAVVGTSLAALDAGLRDVAANVLILEPGAMPLMVIKNLITRFVKSPRVVSEELSRQLSELSQS